MDALSRAGRKGSTRAVTALGLALALSACSLLVGDGDFAVGEADGGAPTDAHRSDARADTADTADASMGPRLVAVSSGNLIQTWCAITSKGDVWCWGDNTYGQLGDGSMTSSPTPVRVVGLPRAATQVSVGSGAVCAVLEGGAAWCWGFAQYGQLGNESVSGNASSKPVPVTGLDAGVLSLSAGYAASCAVKTDGTVWCWGTLGAGDPGGPFTAPNSTPVHIGGLPQARSVVVGSDTACVISRSGGVLCWGGYAGGGTLGNGSYSGSQTPVQVNGLDSGVTSISAAFDTCAVTGDGTVECWGQNYADQLGNAGGMASAVPVAIEGLKGRFTSVSAGYNNVCALNEDGSVWCWGAADDGQLGDGLASLAVDAGPILSGPESPTPVQVKGLSSRATVLTGGDAPCVLTSRGSVECWGFTCEWAGSPVPITNELLGATFSGLSVGGGTADSSAFACVVAKRAPRATILCWGSNLDGQLGNGTTQSSAVPVKIASTSLASSATAVSAGGSFACGISSGAVQCWGDNHVGQLGNGTKTASKTPVAVKGLPSQIVQVSAGATVACAVTKNGAALCWGDDSVGQLGNGATGPPSLTAVPTKLTGGVQSVSAGYDFVCALLTDGTVDCWGNNYTGQLGNGTLAPAPTPTPVTGLSGVVSVSAGTQYACAATATSIECWGFGGNCQFGNEQCQQISMTPVAVSELTAASQVAAGLQSTCAIVGGQAYCWGNTAIGNATFSEIDYATVPVPVNGLLTGVTDIAVGGGSACAVVNDVVRCWGANSAGQLGNGGAVNSLVAAPVTGFR